MLGIFGTIKNPTKYIEKAGESPGQGLFTLISNILKLAGTIAGLFFVVQIIIAGYSFISASGDPKKAELALARIWQSVIGLLIVAGAFVIAAVIGKIIGIDPLAPQIYGPNN